MGAWGNDYPEPERDDDEAEAEDGYGAEEQLRRALEQERHRTDARRFFEAAPLYRIQFEQDGTVSLCRKGYRYWPSRPPAAATEWCPISTHQDLEQAERRLQAHHLAARLLRRARPARAGAAAGLNAGARSALPARGTCPSADAKVARREASQR